MPNHARQPLRREPAAVGVGDGLGAISAVGLREDAVDVSRDRCLLCISRLVGTPGFVGGHRGRQRWEQQIRT
jgi:hypothetical protein